MSSFAQLKAALREWPKIDLSDERFEESPNERLRCALLLLRESGLGFGSADLASLIRQVLRCETVQNGGYPKLTVPAVPPWPSSDAWLRYGFLPVPADPPLLERFKRHYYLSSSQAEAVRAVMLSPAGSVRLVILPTGAGKSLVGLSAALLGLAEFGGVSIITVPTIALAADQVRQARNLCKDAQIDAWQSGLSDQERHAIKDRLRNGNQRLLFAAPESIVGTLAEVLYELAPRGTLRAFVVDEAHLVGQWGTSFRPEFQSMTALWRELRMRCPNGGAFRTLLMTATLTEDSFADLVRFFGPADELETLAAVHLRPEPDYFRARCEDNNLKIDRVLETLRYGPRPAILYVTEVEDAKQWYQRCLQQGWQRTGLMHGECSSLAREKALHGWNSNELDLMVATSAFGLGVDKHDVRLVLHACVPETVDRFYQEVGRGGRDGHASVSMMLWTKEDSGRAERMSSPKIISEELGFDRWKAMWTAGRNEGDVAFIDLQAKRAGVTWDGEHNVAWNLKTLLLLARARVLEIEHSPLSEITRNPGEADEDFRLRSKALREKHQALCPIRLLQSNPLTARAWESQVGVHRDKSKTAAAANWQRMEDVLTARRPLTDILREVYRVPSAGIHDVASEAQAITLIPPRSVCTQLGDPLRCALPGDGKGLLLVTYRTNGVALREMIVALVELLKRLARNGIREVALPAVWRTQTTWPTSLPNPLKSMTANTPENFLIVRRLDEEDPLLHGYIAVPRVSLVPPEQANKPVPEFLLTLNRPVHIILVPEECPDHRNSARRIGEVGPPASMRMEDFQRLLKQ